MSIENIKFTPGYLSAMNELTLGQIILILSHEHDQKIATELVRKYCLQSNVQTVQKQGLEFLYAHGYYKDLQQLINLNIATGIRSNQAWAAVYQIMLDHYYRRYPDEVLRQRLLEIQAKEPELQLIIEIAIMDTFFSQQEYGKIGNLIEKQLELFYLIEDDFLLSCLNQRFYKRLFIYYWKRNEIIMARKYAFRALNQTKNPASKMALHINLGLSYTFDTYYQGMYHLKEALAIAKEINHEGGIQCIEKHNIPFLSAHFGKTRGITSEDISEQAHIEIANGNHNKAIALLEQIDLDSPFKLYYMGLAKQDENLLIESYKLFIEKNSDYFFSRLPINALNKMKEQA